MIELIKRMQQTYNKAISSSKTTELSLNKWTFNSQISPLKYFSILIKYYVLVTLTCCFSLKILRSNSKSKKLSWCFLNAKVVQLKDLSRETLNPFRDSKTRVNLWFINRILFVFKVTSKVGAKFYAEVHL